MDLEDRVRIATPEGVPLDLVVAGLGSRFLAAMLDTLVQFGLLVAPMLVLGASGLLASGWMEAFVLIWFFLVVFGYYPVLETLGAGRTVGKRAAGIRVVREHGGPIGFLTSAVRNLIRVVDFLPFFYGVGITAILVTPRSQRLGDLAAGTYVVRELATPARPQAPPVAGAASDAWAPGPAPPPSASRPSPPPAPPPVDDPGAGSPQPWLEWDVSAITPAETALARRFLQRRWTIDPHARAHLASQFAGRLRPKVPGAPPWPDETLLECVVAAKSARG